MSLSREVRVQVRRSELMAVYDLEFKAGTTLECTAFYSYYLYIAPMKYLGHTEYIL